MQDGAACASHLSRQSVGTCIRCGRFTCEACAKSHPCLECQSLQRAATPHLSGVFEILIGVCVVLYVVCTLVTTFALGELDFTKLTQENFTSGPMLLFFAVEIFYGAVWLGFVGVWLAWYVALLDWARARGVPVPGNVAAIALWFVPVINLGHPWATLRTIRKGTEVRTPIDVWWVLFIGSLVVSTLAAPAPGKGAVAPLLIIGTAMEVAAALLCWKIVRDFRLADRAWDPPAQIALRDRSTTAP